MKRQRGHKSAYVEDRGVVGVGAVLGSAVGPFYCGADHKAYIDLGFYRDRKRRFGAPGDFAQADVLAHEIGHQIQSIPGVSGANARRKRAEPARKNESSIRQELQADCYAGIRGHWSGSVERRCLCDLTTGVWVP